jgi:hypothetical protein
VDEESEARRLTRLMRESTASPWVQVRSWLNERELRPETCAVVTMFPEESGWQCIILLSDG